MEALVPSENEQKIIDEIKAETMYKMVEDVEVTINSSYQTKKVLYLTNSQCSQFNERNIAKCVQAMDLGPLKFIIRLQSCMSTSNTIIAQAQRLHMPEGTYLKSAALSGVEISTRDNLEVMRQLTLWVKECILPIAIQNKALIITWANTECAMGAAVSEVFIPEQQRLGLSCPFRVLGWTEEPQHHYCAVNGIGLAGQLFQNTSRWKDRREITRQANPASDEDLPRADITNCCDRIVILENMNPHELRQEIGPSIRFKSLFMTTIGNMAPAVAFTTFGSDLYGSDVLTFSASQVRNQTPTIYIDSRKRAFTLKPPVDDTEHTDLSKDAHQFPKISKMDAIENIREDGEGKLLESSQRYIVRCAIAMLERQHECFEKAGVVNYYLSSDMSLLIKAMTTVGLSFRATSNTMAETLWERLEIQKSMHEQEKSRKKGVAQSVVREVTDFITMKWSAWQVKELESSVSQWIAAHPGGIFNSSLQTSANDKLQELKAQNAEIDKQHGMKTDFNKVEWTEIFDVLESNFSHSANIFDVDESKEMLRQVATLNNIPLQNSLEANIEIQDAWDYVDLYHSLADSYELITKLMYFLILTAGIALTIFTSENLLGPDETKLAVLILSSFISLLTGYIAFLNPAARWKTIRGAAIRLESHVWQFRTRTGIYRIQKGLTDVSDEQFHRTVSEIKENLLKGADIKNSSFFAHVKSLNRHNQRPPGGYGFGVSEENDGSMSIWKFVRSLCCIDRSRIHNETTEDEDSDNIEMRPISVDSVSISPVHGIEKAQSDLYAEKYKYNPLICPIEEDADGNVSIQDILDTIHDRASKISTISTSKDTHYSPLLPDSYCQFRIGNLLKYYRKHIPRANRLRHFCQILSVGGSISGVFLATYNLQQWAAVTAILVSSASAWLEFTGANEKIARFSSQVHKLTELKHWWETRKSIEKSNINNIDRLVFEVEQLVMSSLSAWSSESNAAKTMSKLAKDKNSDGDGKEGEERSSDLNV